MFALNRTKVQISTSFLRVRPWNFAHVFNVPLPTLLRMGFFIYCFAENVGSLKTQTSPRTTKTRIPGEKKQKQKPKKQSLKARQGHIEHVCKISGSNSQKRRGHWRLKEIGVLCLNQPVFTVRVTHRQQVGGGKHIFFAVTEMWKLKLLWYILDFSMDDSTKGTCRVGGQPAFIPCGGRSIPCGNSGNMPGGGQHMCIPVGGTRHVYPLSWKFIGVFFPCGNIGNKKPNLFFVDLWVGTTSVTN